MPVWLAVTFTCSGPLRTGLLSENCNMINLDFGLVRLPFKEIVGVKILKTSEKTVNIKSKITTCLTVTFVIFFVFHALPKFFLV